MRCLSQAHGAPAREPVRVAASSPWPATRWGVPPALHAAGFLPNARSILGLEAPSSTAYKRRARERLAHGDDLIRRAGLVLASVLNSPRGDRDQPSSVQSHRFKARH